MKTRILAVTLTLMPLAVSCSSLSGVFGGNDGGPESVDDLLTRIERVEAQTQLAQEGMRGAIGGLHGLLASDFEGDPLAAYEEFLERIDKSEARARDLRSSVSAMRSAAGPFFAQWSAKMNSFSNPEMRSRSQQRLTETNERYQDILFAVDPALSDHDALNAGLRDQALFLEHDFNSDSVELLTKDARALTSLAATLDQRLTTTRTAAREYVENTALHGQLVVAEPQAKKSNED